MSGRRFYVGQPVVCVNDKWGPWWAHQLLVRRGVATPTKGTRYVVRCYVDAPPPTCVLLQEISNPLVPYSDGKWREASFAEFRFAPITENQVQAIIAQATDLDVGVDCKEEEDA